MTHKELLAKIDKPVVDAYFRNLDILLYQSALRAVVELHKPELDGLICKECTASETEWYPCPTIQAIEKELNGRDN